MTLLLLALLAADPNADGFALYQKGEYAKAHELFKKAIAQNPKHAFARLNHARTLAVLSKGEAPADYCAFEKNWIMLALADLDVAVEQKRDEILAKLEQPDPGIDLLKKRPELHSWLTAVKWKKGDAPPKSWHKGGAGRIPEARDFDAKALAKATLTVKPWYFDEGKRSFRQLTLDDGTDEWLLGPITSDCE